MSIFSEKQEVKEISFHTASIREDIAALRSMTEELNAKDDEIRKARDEWEKTFNTIPDPLFIISKDGKIINQNKAATKILSLSSNEKFRKVFNEVFYFDLLCSEFIFSSNFIEKIISKQDSVEVSVSSDSIHYLIEGTPIYNGEIIHSIVIIMKNVSEISKMKFQLENILTTSDAGYWEWFPFREEFYGSSRFFELLEIDEFSKCSIEEFNSKLTSIMHPEDSKHLEDAIIKVLRPNTNCMNLEFRVNSKGSNEYRWVFFRGNIVKETTEPMDLRLAGLILDINEMKTLIIQKEEVENLFKYVADTMLDMIWAKNLNGEFIFSNKMNTLTLLDPEVSGIDPIGKTDRYFSDFHVSEGIKRGIDQYYTFASDCMKSDEEVLRTKAPQRTFESGYVLGKFLALDVIKAPLRDKLGNLIGTVGCGRDITEHYRLKKLNDKKTKLLEAITGVSEVLSQIDNWDDVLDSVLDILGDATKSDRAYIFQNEKTESGMYAIEIQEWLAFDAKPLFSMDDLACFDYIGCLHRWGELFKENKAISGNIESFPEKEKIFLMEKNIASLCAVPIFLRNKWWGWIGFDSSKEQEWSEEDSRLLKIVATILGGFFYQRELFQFAKNKLNTYTVKEIKEEVEKRLMLN